MSRAGGSPGAEGALPARTLWGDTWRRFRRHRLALNGALILLLLVASVVAGTFLYPFYLVRQLADSGIPVTESSPTLTTLVDHLDYVGILSPPSKVHPMGADDLGRDLLARAIYGGRVSLTVGLVAMLIATSLGAFIGALSGYFGGLLDNILMRITDLFLSLPGVPLILLIVYLFRESVIQALGSPEVAIFVILVSLIGGLSWMETARIVRAAFLSLREKEFVEAALALGADNSAVMFRHIFPNALGPIIVAATLGVGNAIITESVLSFLGVGFPPDTPTWGRLVTDGSQYLQVAPWLALVPGTLIFLTVLSINFLGDGLRDALEAQQAG